MRPSLNQIDDLLEEIQLRIERNERVLVTTLTKRMAEELNEYMLKLRMKAAYIHSDVDTLDRIRILDDLRAGNYDVLIGVNLLREDSTCGGFAGSDSRRRQGGIPAQPPLAHSDCGPCRA